MLVPPSDESQDGILRHSDVPLESILFTEELFSRPSRPLDSISEHEALKILVQALADSPANILQTLADIILKIFGADSAGVSLLTKDGKRFYWPAIAGQWKPHIGGGTPRDFGPCGDVLDRDSPLMFKHFEQRYTYFLPVTPPIEECLLIPFYVQAKAVGTLWAITHNNHRKFDAEDLRQLESMGRFASAAYQAVEAAEALDRRARQLEESNTKLAEKTAELERVILEAQAARQSALLLIDSAVFDKEALRESNERFKMLADNMSQLAWTCDQLGNVTWYNQRWLDYTGMTFENMAGWDWSKVQHPDHVDRVVEGVKRSRDLGEVWEDTFPLRAKDDTYRWFLSRAVPIRDANGKVVQWFGTNTDVTENRLAEAALIRSEKLAAAGGLAFVLSHEINNPLQAVTNLISVLQHAEELSESTRAYANMAERELRRIGAAANRTLRFQNQATGASSCSCMDLISTALLVYETRLADSGISVEKRKRAEHPVICFAPDISQVISNLIGNSMDAMHGRGGTLYLRSRESKDWRTGQKGLTITVADNGQGMSETTKQRLFEPFYTTKGIGGTGLGLWLSTEIVKNHRGRLSFRTRQSSNPHGTVFTLFLPL